MNAHRYILEPYKGIKTRYRCPSCQRDKDFVRYIDTQTGEHLHPTVGRCNRESNCGYHYTPKQYFQDNNISFDTPKKTSSVSTHLKNRKQETQPKQVSFIPVEVFKASLNAHETNHFVQFLINLFGVEVTSQLISRYFIGTSKHWHGATVFWQIDTQGKIRTGKIMLYDPNTGKRYKHEFTFFHKLIKQPEFELKQCFFGEHLLIDKTKPVAIVESEKTAIIASVYLPQFIWIASGGLHGLNADKCSILKGRSVVLFPDMNAFEKWSNKAKELSYIANFTVSDLLERKTTPEQRAQGLDLADYFIKHDWRIFRKRNIIEQTLQPEAEKVTKVTFVTPKQNNTFSHKTLLPKVEVLKTERIEQPQNWSNDIAELENYFAGITLPTQPVKLNKCSTITDCSLFIESHFATVKANNGNQTFLPYLNRLQELKQILTNI